MPAARLVGIDLQLRFGPIPPVLVPLRGRVCLEHLLATFPGKDKRAYLAVDEGRQLVEDYLDFVPPMPVSLTDVAGSRSLADTILRVADVHTHLLDGHVILNLGDTALRDLSPDLLSKDFVAYAHTEETERWTLFQEGSAGQLTISDKLYQPEHELWKTFLGVWGIADFRRFAEILRVEMTLDTGPAFYRSIQTYYEERPTTYWESKEWIDFGHLDNLNDAKRRDVNARYFNTLSFGDDGATVLKKSENREKLIQEIRWALRLPRELEVYTPRMFSVSENPLDPHIEMEFYGYPSLDECFLYSQYDLDTWDKVFRKLFGFISKASKYQVHEPDLDVDLREMYVTKTIARIEQFLGASNEKGVLATTTFELDGVLLPTLHQVMQSLKLNLKQVGALRRESFSIVHGDLCLSNVLYDALSGLIKLIDPRGKFGRHDLYGDPNYDVAKLSHSVLGHYDFLVHKQYRLDRLAQNSYSLVTAAKPNHHQIARVFERHVVRNDFDLNRIRLLESLLFLSMLPLHQDDSDRQLAMLLTGLRIYGEATA